MDKTIKTASGATVVLRTDISGRQARSIKNSPLKGQRMTANQEMSDVGVDLADITEKRQDAMIEAVVVSVNGKTEDILLSLIHI